MGERDIEVLALSENRDRLGEVALLLHEAFEEWPESWPTLESAEAEVGESLGADRISLVAVSSRGRVVGWIGGISMYQGRVWELHPLAVRRDVQGRGVGRLLVSHLEAEVRRRGCVTLYLGTDDVANLTSIGGVDLYPGVLDKVARLENLRRHPFGFYLRVGFEVVGVVPDANGYGRPDIMMAKRVV
ncbi:MAG: GNAT family N-acetyltransferase [Longimicrobiales bacterium]